MNKSLHQSKLIFLLTLSVLGINAQISFTNSNTLLHSKTGVVGSNGNSSGNSLTVVDMNNDGLDDICKLTDSGEVRIEIQKINGTFDYLYCGTMAAVGAWSMCAGDVDRNGWKDVITGYGGALKLMKIGPSGSIGVSTLPNSNFFVQNMNFMDVNKDGWIDIFACDDNSFSKLWLNDGTGNFPAEAGNTVINFDITSGQTTNTSNDDSGNYGSVWTDFDNDGDIDLYVAKCRQAVLTGTDPRRIDVMFVNNGNNIFTAQTTSLGLGSGDQDWTSSFGDINNDGKFDLFLTKHNTSSRLYSNDGTGHFTGGATIAFGNMPMQSQFEDLDNDGFVDLIITGDNDHRIYHNNGNGTFTDVTPANLTVTKNGLSFASGDLNHDGKIDLYFSYGSTYNNSGTQADIFWKNTTANNNHYITIVPSASVNNRDGLGVRAFIYGSWGVQTREVRAGESYGTLNSGHLHFGLGTATTIDSLVVNWPNGQHVVVVNPAIDQFITIGENGPCNMSAVTITASGATTFCAGGNVTLSAPTGTGNTYLWSNGATTSSITATTAGAYAVQVFNGGCSANSNIINVVVSPDETPTVAASQSTLVFCQGANVSLTSSVAASYQWYLNGNAISGATSQSIVPNQSGNYAVAIQGTCQTWTSTTTSVTVNPAPAVPNGVDVYISAPQSVTLTATGTNDVWFDAPTGGNQLATGNNYVTPVVAADTTFYVEDQTSYGGSSNLGGQKYHSGTKYSGNATNAYTTFNVAVACTLHTVKVYTDSAGSRLIELRNNAGAVLNSLLINLPADTSVITLDFPLSIGNGYRLATNTNQNMTEFGTNNPWLRRSSTGVSYPYNINGLVSIIGNSIPSATNYYYFYDWNVVETPMVCPSSRHPQSVLFNTGLHEAANQLFAVYPNPASSAVNIRVKTATDQATQVSLTDMLGKAVYSANLGALKKDQVITVDVSALAKGIYFVHFVQNGNKITQKIIVD